MASKKKKPVRRKTKRVIKSIEKAEPTGGEKNKKDAITQTTRKTRDDAKNHKFATMSGGILALFMIMVTGVLTIFIIINQALSIWGPALSIIELVLSAIIAFSFTAFMFGHGKHYRPSFTLSLIALVFLSVGVYVITLLFLGQLNTPQPYRAFFAYLLASIVLILFAYPIGYKSKLEWP